MTSRTARPTHPVLRRCGTSRRRRDCWQSFPNISMIRDSRNTGNPRFRCTMRIHCPVIERCGALLEQIPGANGRQPENGELPPRYSCSQAAADAGLSEDQKKQALRVASVPAESFEAQVESDAPPILLRLPVFLGKRQRWRDALVLGQVNRLARREDAHIVSALLCTISDESKSSLTEYARKDAPFVWSPSLENKD